MEWRRFVTDLSNDPRMYVCVYVCVVVMKCVGCVLVDDDDNVIN